VDVVEYACALPVDGERVLLGLRAPHRRNRPACWDTIGGHLEQGEPPDVALVRELQEEVGLTPTTFQLFTVLETTEPDGVTPARWHLFAVTEWMGGEPAITNDEHTEIRWFGFGEAEVLQPLASEDYRAVFAQLRATFGGSE